jgi:hypothetical protein
MRISALQDFSNHYQTQFKTLTINLLKYFMQIIRGLYKSKKSGINRVFLDLICQCFPASAPYFSRRPVPSNSRTSSMKPVAPRLHHVISGTPRW